MMLEYLPILHFGLFSTLSTSSTHLPITFGSLDLLAVSLCVSLSLCISLSLSPLPVLSPSLPLSLPFPLSFSLLLSISLSGNLTHLLLSLHFSLLHRSHYRRRGALPYAPLLSSCYIPKTLVVTFEKNVSKPIVSNRQIKPLFSCTIISSTRMFAYLVF